jgi:N utilization substance protein A
MLVTLGENGVKTLDDFADLAGDELLEMLSASDKGGAKLELEEANALIMKARAHWFEGDEAASTAAAPAAVEPAPAGRE